MFRTLEKEVEDTFGEVRILIVSLGKGVFGLCIGSGIKGALSIAGVPGLSGLSAGVLAGLFFSGMPSSFCSGVLGLGIWIDIAGLEATRFGCWEDMLF